MMRRINHYICTISLLLGVFFLASCSNKKLDIDSSSYPTSSREAREDRHGKLTGDGIKLFGGSDDKKSGGVGAGIGINSYLWRATLDTLSFLPLASADPFGGVIITDWYEIPEADGERFKINVLILDSDLLTNALKVSVFKQVKNDEGIWKDSKISNKIGNDLETKILTRARELRLSVN